MSCKMPPITSRWLTQVEGTERVDACPAGTVLGQQASSRWTAASEGLCSEKPKQKAQRSIKEFIAANKGWSARREGREPCYLKLYH